MLRSPDLSFFRILLLFNYTGIAVVGECAEKERSLYRIGSRGRRTWRGLCGPMRQPVPQTVVRFDGMVQSAQLNDSSQHKANASACKEPLTTNLKRLVHV